MNLKKQAIFPAGRAPCAQNAQELTMKSKSTPHQRLCAAALAEQAGCFASYLIIAQDPPKTQAYKKGTAEDAILCCSLAGPLEPVFTSD